ncbi:MAG: tetratricopeptide repeat protein [Acidobacteria bacterium]|nr:tetratricopeptide repeat protein [Acidobacteriota bacterium]
MKTVILPFCIFSPFQDLVFILLTPLLILLTFSAAKYGGWTESLVLFGLALAVGHYFPGILRAYGDKPLFRRYAIRLILAPVFLIIVTGWFAYRDLRLVILLQMLWGGWHWAMQVYGFARIYDAKNAVEARMSPLMDRTICVLWFGMCLLINDPAPYIRTFYESGGQLLNASAVRSFTQLWFVATIAVTVLYAIASILRRRWPNPLKVSFLVLTFVYLSYTTSMIEHPTVGFVMFESWHDIQYLAIVWFFNINRVKKVPNAGFVLRCLFRPRAILVLAYIGLCLVFGLLNFAWNLFENEAVVRVVLSLVTSAALLHYYLDGFIWRIRENETRDALGVHSSPSQPPILNPAVSISRLVPAWGRHALLWLLFLAPVALYLVNPSSRTTAMIIQENVTATLPDSPLARLDLANALKDAGRLREGKIHFEKAIELAPELLEPRIVLGMVLAQEGDLAGARSILERALTIAPDNAEAHNNLAVVLDEQGDSGKARRHLERAVDLNPGNALYENNLGRVLAKIGDLENARRHHEQALRIDPEFSDASYQLGITLAKQGDLNSAMKHLREAVRIDPANYLAHNALGGILMNMGKMSQAKVHFEHALQINPGYLSAQQNLARALEDLGEAQPR